MCAVIFGIVTMITLAWSGWAVREGQATTQTVSVGAVQAYLRTLKNKSFVIVVFAFFVASLFEAVGFSIFPFLIGFWYYLGDMQAMNTNLFWLMMPLFFVSFPAVWFWTFVSAKIGKKPAVLVRHRGERDHAVPALSDDHAVPPESDLADHDPVRLGDREPQLPR